MEIKAITSSDALWVRVMEYAAACSWRAGPFLAEEMRRGAFSDWERVVVALEGEALCGYCVVSKTDCIPDVPYTPYIGFLFVGEAHRGRRLSQKLIEFAKEYLRTAGFAEVYLVSDHENLYEKYGFTVIDRKTAFWGGLEKIYTQKL